MKKWLIILGLSVLSQVVLAQQQVELQENLFSLLVLSPGVSYEKSISDNQSLYLNANFGMNIQKNDDLS